MLELEFIQEAKKMIDNTLKKVMYAIPLSENSQTNDCLFNLVSHVLNKISNPKLEGRKLTLACRKANKLMRLVRDLVMGGEEDPVMLQCQFVSNILQNRDQNCLLTNAKFGGHRLISKFKTKLFNPFDGQPSHSTTEDFAILLYQSLEKKYSTELKYRDYFPAAAIKLDRP